MKIGREAAKQMFRDDKNSQGCYRSVMTKIDKIYDSIEDPVNKNDVSDLPRELTAENGAKALLIGEFIECFYPDDSGNPYIVPVSWDTIKKIYNKIVSHYSL